MKLIGMIGRRFGKLVVVSRETGARKKPVWLCRCDCGNEQRVRGDHLRDGRIFSCGCYRAAMAKQLFTTHGLSKTREYRIWRNMKNRCEWDKYPEWRYYGGRGITVCRRWSDSFEAFLEDMGLCTSPKHSIDRMDPDKGYEPQNCRWATATEQARNTRKYRERHGITTVA